MRVRIPVVAGVAVVLSLSLASAAPSHPRAEPFAHSFFNRPLARDAPIDPHSKKLSRQLANLAYGLYPQNRRNCVAIAKKNPADRSPREARRCPEKTFAASINTDAYTPPVYRVGKHVRHRQVKLDNRYDPSLNRALRSVPIPRRARPAPGTDSQMVIYQPSSDRMWEFWRARRVRGTGWVASWGGRIERVSQSPGYYRDIAHPGARSYREQHNWGEPATSIPNLPGLIKVSELRRRRIDHALNFSILAPKPGSWVFPAQRTDGWCSGTSCTSIPEGARFRLRPSYDVSKLRNPVVRTIARAVQKYGMVLNNKTGAGLNFYAEGWRAQYAHDPYTGRHGIFTEAEPDDPWAINFMRAFPWTKIQMLRRGTTCSDRAHSCAKPAWWRKQFAR